MALNELQPISLTVHAKSGLERGDVAGEDTDRDWRPGSATLDWTDKADTLAYTELNTRSAGRFKRDSVSKTDPVFILYDNREPEWFKTTTSSFSATFFARAENGGNTDVNRQSAVANGAAQRELFATFAATLSSGEIVSLDGYSKIHNGSLIFIPKDKMLDAFNDGIRRLCESWVERNDLKLSDPLTEYDQVAGYWKCSTSVNVTLIPASKMQVDLVIINDSITGETLVNPKISDLEDRGGSGTREEAERLDAALAQQQTELSELRAAMMSASSGTKIAYTTREIPSVYTTIETPYYRNHFLDWFAAFQTEMLKLSNLKPASAEAMDAAFAKWLALPANVGKTRKDYDAYISSLINAATPGDTTWASAWNLVKQTAGGAWDVVSGWKPTDVVGAYAGYKAVSVGSDVAKSVNPMFLIGAIGVAAVLILKD